MINSPRVLSHILFNVGLRLYNHGLFKCIEYQGQKQDVTIEHSMIRCFEHIQGPLSSCKRHSLISHVFLANCT